MTAIHVHRPQRRHRSVVVAMTLAVAIAAGGLGLASPASAAPGTASIAVSPGTVDTGDTLTVTVGLPGSCAEIVPADVPVVLRPTGAEVDQGWSGDVYVGYDFDVHAYQGSTTVTVADLLAANSTRGSWTATALLDEIGCGDDVEPVSTTFTVQALATTTTVAPTTTAAGPTTSIQYLIDINLVKTIAEDANGRIEVRLTFQCGWTHFGNAQRSGLECWFRSSMVAIAGENGLFAPGTEIEIWVLSDPTKVGTTTANADGGFETSVEVPNIPTGEHTLLVAGTGPDGQPVAYKMPIYVGDAEAPGELAFTGSSDQTPWFALGGVMAILVGMALIGMTLRREPVLVEMRSLRPIRPVDPRRRRTSSPD